jgi:ABC-type dipeptide/oligopeptide/nickel transport system permease component
MGRYLAWRALRMLLTILVVAAVTFVALRAAGDPASLLLPPDATPAQREELRRAFGLDQPLALQYARFVARAAQGDFGESLRYRTPAMPLVLERLPATLELTLAGLGLALVVSIGLGILAALREGRPVDLVIVSGSLLGQSIPTFWLGLMLVLLFAVTLGLVPTSGAGSLRHLILPAVSLSAALVADTVLLARSGMLETLREDYVRTARAKGLAEWAVVGRHALPNVLIPIVTVVGLYFGPLLGGAVIIESVFAWPGIGQLVVQSVFGRDFPVVQAASFLLAVSIVVTNFLVDLLYRLLDPRIELG